MKTVNVFVHWRLLPPILLQLICDRDRIRMCGACGDWSDVHKLDLRKLNVLLSVVEGGI